MKSRVKKTFGVWIRRIAFLLVGLVLAVVFWESVFTFWALQKKHDNVISLTVQDQKKYKILALGESTTATINGPAWPEYLEKILNEESASKKFRVINAGVSGTTTKEVAAKISDYISLYRPQMVISMLGINDITYPDNANLVRSPYQRVRHSILESRVYRFVSILVRQIVGRQSKELLGRAATCTDVSLGETAFQLLVTQNETDQETAVLKYVSTYPFSFHGYQLLIDFYASQNKWNEVSAWVERAQFMEPFIRFCAKQAMEGQSKDQLQELTRHINWMFYYIGTIENIARNVQAKKGNIDPSWYKQIANTLHTPPSDTNVYYPIIAKRLRQENIVHIAMQYPLLSLENLRVMLGNVDDIVYIDNEDNFQQALQTLTYDDLFVDHFTGVFGHTTEFGSKLIAERAAKVVKSMVLTQ